MWHSVKTGVLASVATLTSTYPNADSMLITSHSLGASISLFAALDLAHLYPSWTQHLYNFGEPRVGTEIFAQWAVTQLQDGKQFRVTHKRDPVPHVPPMSFNFLHTPHELWYDNDGDSSWKDCRDSASGEDPHCSDSELPIDIRDHLRYLGKCTTCERQPDSEGKCPL